MERPRYELSRPAVKRWASPARPSTGSLPCHCRKDWHRFQTNSPTPKPHSSSSSAPEPLTHRLQRLPTTRTPSPVSADVSMGFPLPSSWRPPGSSSCHRNRLRRGCRTDSGCSPAAREPLLQGNERSRRPWTGVTSCCQTSNDSCSAGSPRSPPRGRSRPPSTCVVATASTSTTCSICCPAWSASHWWWLTANSPGRDGTAFSKQSANMRVNGSCWRAPPVG